ncbi:MAG: GTPase [Ruthenibacterium lactatiformans]
MVGHPQCGKSTFINSFAARRAKVADRPGVTAQGSG